MNRAVKKAASGLIFCNGALLAIHPNIGFKNSDGREAVMNLFEVFPPAKYPSF
jgi:hypothetical protein